MAHAGAGDIDLVLNAGDSTVYHVFDNETLDWFRQRRDTWCILGNTDCRVLDILQQQPLPKPRSEEKRVMYFWSAKHLSAENTAYLSALPKQMALTVAGWRIGLFHGSPAGFEKKLFPDDPEKKFRALAEAHDHQIIITGHTHTPYWKEVAGVHFINPGSCGRMFDGDPRPSFAIIDLTPTSIRVEHFRIPYQLEEAIQALADQGLPAIYMEMYRQGRKLN